MSETTGSGHEQTQTLEEMWAGSRASRLQTYEKLTGNGEYRAQQQQDFISGEIDNPILDAPNLDQVDLDTYISELWELLRCVEDHTEEPSLEREAYDSIIAGKLAEVYYLHQSRNLLDMSDGPERIAGGEWIMQQARELYGLPEWATFNSMIRDLRSKLINHRAADILAYQIRQELLAVLPEITGTPETDNLNYNELIDLYKPLVDAEFSGLLTVVPEDKDEFTPEDMVQVFSDGLKYYEGTGIVEPGKWSSKINPDSKSINTNQEDCTIEVGAGRTPLDNVGMRRLLLHEVGVHVQRRLMGERSDLAALGSGLVGYTDPEEGLGVVMEQIYSGETREAGVQYYTLLGFAVGLDGYKRNFRDTYEIAWRRQVMLDILTSDEKLAEEVILKAKNQAYSQCVRIFRGTPCDLPGVVYPKDIAYHDGNAQIWKYLDRIRGNKAAFRQLFMGKFNPADPDQMKLVESTVWSK
ncbi:MAG TPA: tyrosine/phenylalanine carboxypeptidase domain-containing protein [Candidatus Saccharimonadales bacterium]|nr:tyrosine/phenylalanine carboxypeptidase domain-containing protein [Candidatus Saccharimonadales bacterium]